MNQKKKYALAGGYCLYAPRFPRFAESPGFPDEACISNANLPSVFFLAFVEKGKPLAMQFRGQVAEDGRVTATFDEPGGLKVVEKRFLAQDDRFVSELELTNAGKADREITVVQWTTTDPEGEPVSLEGDSFRIRRLLKDGNKSEVPADVHYNSPDSKGAHWSDKVMPVRRASASAPASITGPQG